MPVQSSDVPSFMAGGGEMGARIRAFDWAATSLGRPETWPEVLRAALRICLSSAFPTAVYWGADLVLLYNDSWAPIPAERHPGCLGKPAREVWGDIWTVIEPQFDDVTRTGQGFSASDQLLMMERDGVPLETFWDYSFTPLSDETGAVRGVFNQGVERTLQVLGDRRQAFRLELEDVIRGEPDPRVMVDRAVAALGRHLGANRVGYGEMLGERAVLLQSSYAEGVAPIHGTYDLEGFGRVAVDRQRRGETVSSADVLADPVFEPAAWQAVDARAFVSVPLVREGGLRAILFVNQREPRRWSAAERDIIEATAARIWDAIERAQAEAALRDSENHLSSIFRQTGAGFAEMALDGRFLSVNDQFCAMVGRSREALLAMAMRDITHPDSILLSDAIFAQVVESRQPATIEKQLLLPDGSSIWVANTKSLIASVQGRPSVLAVSIDITARKKVEKDLEDAKLAAETANLAKSTFIANMSHELRTPLSAIIGYSEMMLEEIEEGAEGADLAADMRKIEGNARHLLGLINDVLDLSKVESGKMEIFVEEFAVGPMVEELATTVQSLVARKNNDLLLRLEPEIGSMHSDLTKVRQILLNLLSNAAKFTEAGAITLAVRREGAPDGEEQIVFTVADSGIGMTAEQLGRLFQRFQQADSSTTRRFGGTGLGLSLSKAFADMLGGTVTVQSELGSGTSFALTVPVRFSVAAPPGQDAAPTRLASGDDGAGDLVLVIDDDENQRVLMTRFLQREGFRARTAADGESGLALARDLKPRAILLDVMMPGIDGWSVLSALKADPHLAEIPVVMVTFLEQRALASSLGAADYVLKPVQWDRFKAVMDRFRGGTGGVLVVEDDGDTRQRLRTYLEKDGWTVVEAEHGQAGLDRLAAARPAVVLLDLNMPVMDGFTFLQRLREQPEHGETPVVVLTARDLSRADRQRLAGASQVLHKGDVSLRALADQLAQLAGDARIAE